MRDASRAARIRRSMVGRSGITVPFDESIRLTSCCDVDASHVAKNLEDMEGRSGCQFETGIKKKKFVR